MDLVSKSNNSLSDTIQVATKYKINSKIWIASNPFINVHNRNNSNIRIYIHNHNNNHLSTLCKVKVVRFNICNKIHNHKIQIDLEYII